MSGAGAAVLESDTGAGNIAEALQNYLGPDASDAARRDITMFPGLRQTHLTLEEHSAHFQSARQRAEARLPNGGILQERLCPHCASAMRVFRRIKNRKSILRKIQKSACGDLLLEAVKRNMRRILGPCGMGMKQEPYC